jgi:predicted ATPase
VKAKTFLSSFRVENFKAIEDSKVVKLTPLTVLIGNNGSGKSSFIEGIETYRDIVVDGLDSAMGRFLGFQHVWNKRARHGVRGDGLSENPVRFAFAGRIAGQPYRADMKVNAEPAMRGIRIEAESVNAPRGHDVARDLRGKVNETTEGKEEHWRRALDPGESVLTGPLRNTVKAWQFLALAPERMGMPHPKKLAANGALTLNRDGSNLAQYLLSIRDKDTAVFDGIVESMKFVLDYAANFEPVETQEIQREMFVRMRERDFDIPGWMLSTGTLRVLALLAVLRNPDPPPLVVIEEIENGLDPRTIHMVLEEIRTAVQSGSTQVIVATHSPYFLDLVPLETLVLVERKAGGDPVFRRPAGDADVREWAKGFAPGQLYTMGRLDAEEQP